VNWSMAESVALVGYMLLVVAGTLTLMGVLG